MADEAIIIGEGWLSEHFFTTDAKSQSFQAQVLARRKEWDEQDTDGTRSTRARFNAIRAQLESRLAILEPGSNDLGIREDLYDAVLETLGYQGGGYRMEREGPLLRVTQPGLSEVSPLVIIEGRPADTIEDLLVKDAHTLLVPFETDTNEKHAIDSVARLLSAVFVEGGGPIFALVLAGKWLLVAERDRWAEGRYLAVDLQLVVARNDTKRGGEIDRALTCVASESLAPDADGDIWWTKALEESIKHTVGVSQDLREGVRLSIEIIANDVVARRLRGGLEPLPQAEAQTLAKESLRFLYRILFLLFAEASPELKVLPVGASEYEEGYSLDRLRELTLVTLATEQAEHGTHFYESLAVLFRLVDQGHGVRAVEPVETSLIEPVETSASDLRDGLTFNSLRADLFLPKATALIDEVKLSDAELQKVLAHLLLSKEQKGRDRGFISYADLGINQLGAVYEGLMSYTGFFAETELYEVAKDGNAEKGSWVVPVERSEGIDAKDFVKSTNPITGEVQAVVHDRGSFVFRLASRERQQSASYYTPEVLTRFTVSQALEELLDQNGSTTTAAEILELTVCEPALGSGAFALEAVRQVAAEYLKRRQKELGKDIDPDAYPRELQKVKASIALHQVYGVDLNATAVELAEISLWLDTMSEDLQAPWFGLHLKRGNSLIGSRRAVYSRDQVNSKTWLKAVPRDVPVVDLAEDIREGRVASGLSGSIHHFLLPSEGWGSATEAKEAKELAPEALAALKAWRRQITIKPTKKQLDQLAALAMRVETLWQFALRRLEIAEREVRRKIPLWGSSVEPAETTRLVSREDIEAKLADTNGAYQRLRRVMDAWNALWFWPLTDTLTQDVQPPTLDEWINGLAAVLGTHFEAKKNAIAQGQATLSLSTEWTELGTAEEIELSLAGASPVSDALVDHPWLSVSERIAAQQGFFHWELDFVTVFARGGFDLQVGNPPWVRPRSDVAALLAEGDPWWQLTLKPTQAQIGTKRKDTLSLDGIANLVLEGTSDVAVTAAFVGSAAIYPHLGGVQPNLYLGFMEQVWRHGSSAGTIGLIHPETHFTDEKAALLRGATYLRLRRHWHFLNERILFEIDDKASFGIHVYGRAAPEPSFQMATYIYHPDVVVRSLGHDGSGEEPGLKDRDGNWDLRPHRNRVTNVTDETLKIWHAILEDDSVPVRQTRMVYAVNRATAAVLEKLSHSPRISELGLEFSRGWDESIDRKKGVFEVNWGEVPAWREAILQGPHLFVAIPFYKSPNPTMLHNQDWSAVDLETLTPDALPITSYKPAIDSTTYDATYSHWGLDRVPARDSYRIAWRNMAANKNERTLIAAVIPPGAAHVNAVTSAGAPSAIGLIQAAASLSSIVNDFVVRATTPSTVNRGVVRQLSLARADHPLFPQIALRTLRLNVLTEAYSSLWHEAFDEEFLSDAWQGGLDYTGRSGLGVVSAEWEPSTPLRRASDRRQALVEMDAIFALMLGVTANELCTIYRAQFAVLYGYDRNVYFYDANGRLVPSSVLTVWRAKGQRATEDERTATNAAGNTYTYERPFVTLDREADMRQAYAHFETILKDRS
ncbi:class I SAM-dependent DNA methyltransferase [Glaciihabitans sp. GrIS 2.15]|uniref:class I SAM-dependent DNA methyltransferase n=1 Tax=Glaciihabitans sp. GrIS 2.15 TaxID=3071710 RepID=UPI002DF7EBF7|nr:hypothetical protein [Glaciihabitans sp. GrIS 2.15]